MLGDHRILELSPTNWGLMSGAPGHAGGQARGGARAAGRRLRHRMVERRRHQQRPALAAADIGIAMGLARCVAVGRRCRASGPTTDLHRRQ